MTKQRIGWILTIAVIATLVIPTLVQDGMFLDGVTYSAVSKNMASGYGSRLKPHYTQTLYADFREQPPLALIIHSFFFKLSGNAFYTERIFCLFILILTIIGARQCWRLVAENDWKDYDWFPVPFIKIFLEKLSSNTLLWIRRISHAALLLVLLFAVTRFGKFSRDSDQLMDIYAIAKAIPEGTIMKTTKDLSEDWLLIAYLSRIGYLSLDCSNHHEYYLLEKSKTIESMQLEKYVAVDLGLRKYILLKTR